MSLKQFSLSDVCTIKHGYAFKGEYFSDTITKDILLTPGNFKIGGGFKKDKLKYYDGPIDKNYILKPYDLIVTMTDLSKKGDTLGYSALVPNDENVYLHNQRIGLIENINEEIIDKNYLYWLLRDVKYHHYIVSSATGTTVKHTSPKTILKYEFELPSLKEQKFVSEILTNIETKIKSNEKINRNLEDQLNLIFDDYFVKCNAYDEDSLVKTDWGKIPPEWKNIDFGDLIQITSGDRPDEKSETKTKEFNIPLFGASKIMGYTKEFSYDEDILIIGRVGTHGVVQRVNYPCFPSDNTFVIKSNYYGFVYQLLKRIDYDSLNTGSTQPLITQKSLKTVNVVLPDENTLSRFEKISKIYFDNIYNNQKEITSLTKLRDTLLPKLMSGEIDVSEINCDLE